MKVHSIQWHRAARRQQRVHFIAFEDYVHECALTEINVSQTNYSIDVYPDLARLSEPGLVEIIVS